MVAEESVVASDVGSLVLPGKRYGIIRALGTRLCDIGRRSVAAFNDVCDALEPIIEDLDEKHTLRPVGRPPRAGIGAEAKERGAEVRNPTKAKKGKGRSGIKRKRGAGGK